ncbi:MAG: FIST signal transduction protein [Xanthobacteraceae bacterium]
MRAEQLHWSEPAGWHRGDSVSNADLVLYFGARGALADGTRFHELRSMFPEARILGCTGEQISGVDLGDEEIAAVAMRFRATRLKLVCEEVPSPEHSRSCGESIGRELMADGLAGIFVLCDGLRVNGGNLVAGMTAVTGHRIPVTGGLAGDGAAFRETLVSADCAPRSQIVGAIGFYGDEIRIGHGMAGGWDGFGPRRRVTKSNGNVVLELDGQPALDLYERYLDEDEIKGLPFTALRFPLQIQDPQRPNHEVIRAIVGIDRDDRSLIFAGDVPVGWMGRLMRGNFDHLAAGAAEAARQARGGRAGNPNNDEVSLIVSCIGRRLLMGQRITEELEALGEVASPIRAGFYSYGEISPHAVSGACELHNQTMTVTSLREAVG